jgi:RimJ/RimL family protein N-acetyltransferase
MDDIELQTDRLRLRRLTPADAGRLAAIADDIRIARNLTPAFPHPYTLDDAVEFIASRPQGLGIEPVDGDNGIVGMVGGSERGDPYRGVFSFGYWLGVKHWGNGYATEAGRAFLDHIVETAGPDRGIRRIEASAYGWNPASARVLTKLGLGSPSGQLDHGGR